VRFLLTKGSAKQCIHAIWTNQVALGLPAENPTGCDGQSTLRGCATVGDGCSPTCGSQRRLKGKVLMCPVCAKAFYAKASKLRQ
jgi:hypothetical protein